MISIIGSPAQFSQQLLGGVSGQPGNNGSYAPEERKRSGDSCSTSVCSWNVNREETVILEVIKKSRCSNTFISLAVIQIPQRQYSHFIGLKIT